MLPSIVSIEWLTSVFCKDVFTLSIYHLDSDLFFRILAIDVLHICKKTVNWLSMADVLSRMPISV